ncbi:hypothetical protein ZWY2020_046351 [Hordeum vulgare]|nr:hypothetical protein ZWY2020_046351 [Hordeum vulgare]
MADLLLLTLLPLAALLFLALHHAPHIKALLTRAMSVLAPELSTVWKPQPANIFVTDHETAHSLLVRSSAGGCFSNRPPSISPSAILSRRRHQNITSAPYGQHWRAIRHNLTSELLHPARLRRHAAARRARSMVSSSTSPSRGTRAWSTRPRASATPCLASSPPCVSATASTQAASVPWPTPRVTSSSPWLRRACSRTPSSRR